MEPETTLINGAYLKSLRVRKIINKKTMNENSQSIVVDIYVSVLVRQEFKVPVDYEIDGSTPFEAYADLIADFGEQNINAFREPFKLYLDNSVPDDFIGVGNDFAFFDNQEKMADIFRFQV